MSAESIHFHPETWQENRPYKLGSVDTLILDFLAIFGLIAMVWEQQAAISTPGNDEA